MKFQLYLPGQIQAQGMIRERMLRTVHKILHHTRIREDFLSHFQNRKEKPTAPGGFVGCGMLLDSVVKAAAQNLGGEELLTLKNQFVGDLLATQSADGAISIFSGAKGTWDNHEQAYVIQALIWNWRYFRHQPSLDGAVRLGNYLIAEKTTANIGLEQALLMLFEETQDRRFLAYCENELNITGTMEDYDDILPVNGTAHVYTYLARTLAQLKYAQITGSRDPRLFSGMKRAFDRLLHQQYAAVTGGISAGFCWGEVWDNTQTGLGLFAETCTAAYLLRDCTQMFAEEGDVVYGDVFERVMYNTFFAAQSDDGCLQKYFVPFNEKGNWYEHDTYCCPNNFKRMVFELPQAIFLKAEDGIAVNLYNAAELDDDRASLKLTGDYPDGDCMTLELTPKTDREFALYFRIPRWCKDAEIRIGKECFHGEAGTLLKIRRRWESCRLEIRLPMTVRFIAGKNAQTGKAAAVRGPVVYGYKGAPGHVVALARFAPEEKLEYKDRKIITGIRYRFRGIQHKTLELVPFYDPERYVTYFFAPDGTEPDELFQ